MDRQYHKKRAEYWIDLAEKIVGRKDTQTALMYAQVHATLATVNDE